MMHDYEPNLIQQTKLLLRTILSAKDQKNLPCLVTLTVIR